MKFRPLRALLPSTNRVAQSIVCPPYDVLSRSEAIQLLSENPQSFLRVVRPDSVHPTLSPYESTIYQAAADALHDFQHNGTLVRDEAPCLFVYEQQMGARKQRGLVGLVAVSDYCDGVIRKHERTRPEKEQDRTRLTQQLSANTGPVFLTYRDVPQLDTIVNTVTDDDPHYNVTADGVVHRVWRVGAQHTDNIIEIFDALPQCYIADGHHRAASAASVGKQRREAAGASWNGTEDYNYFLAVLFPAGQLHIMSYNRLVSDLNGLSEQQFVETLAAMGGMQIIDTPQEEQVPEAGKVWIYVGNKWYENTLGKAQGNRVADKLDCDRLQQQVLKAVLSIDDPRKSDRVEFVGGIRGLQYLQTRVESGQSAAAFVLHPVSTEQLMEVADRDEIMPPKCTWFEPKLRSGFFVHTF